MASMRLVRWVCGLAVLALWPPAARADSLFTVSSSPTLAVESGVAELTGSFMLTLSGGVTEPGRVQVFLSPSVTITNSLATGLQLTGTGDLTGARIDSVSPSPGYLTITIPEGAVVGSLTVSGLRVDLSGGAVRSLQAIFSVAGDPGMTFTNNAVTLIARTFPGLAVDANSDTALIGGQGRPIKPTLTYTLREGYGQAFTSTVGRFGQNNSTQVRITVRNLLEGVALRFPGVIRANESAATLRTATGRDVALTAEDGETTVVYRFVADAFSDAVLESFTLSIPVITGRVERGATAIQASLGPLALSPDDTAVPRYRPLLVPALETTGIPYEDLYLPGARVTPQTDTGLAFANPLRTDIRVRFQALTTSGDPLSGPGVNNPVVRTLAARGQLATFASTLFNLPPDFDGAFSIKATAEFGGAFALFSFFSTRDSAIQGGIQAGSEARREFILPKVASEAGDFTTVHLFNPNDRPAVVTLDFVSRQGQTVESTPVSIPPRGAVNLDARSLFSPGAIAEGGYILGRSDLGVVSSEVFGRGAVLGGLSGQATGPTYGPELYVSHFAQGAGIYSEVNLINRADAALDIEARILDDRGQLLRDPEIGENPTRLRVPKDGQFLARLDELFRIAGGRLITGQLVFEVLTFRGFYPLSLSMAGSLVIGGENQKFLAALPLVLPPARQLFFAQVIEERGIYTGLSLLNPSERLSSNITLSVYRSDGTLVGSRSFTLRPQERLASLVRDLVPEAFGMRTGLISVRASEYVQGYSLVGSERLDFLTAGPPQRKD